MKFVKKSISLYVSICVTVLCILSSPVSVKANSIDDNTFQQSVLGYYMVEDSNNMPTSKRFFYKYADGKAWFCSITDVFALLANKSYGLSFNLATLSALVNGFDAYLGGITGTSSVPKPENVLSGGQNGTVIGWALNDITGCKLIDPQGNKNVAIDSNVNNFIYIYVKDYIDDTVTYPDYFILNLPHFTAQSLYPTGDYITNCSQNMLSLVGNDIAWRCQWTYDQTNDNMYYIFTNNYRRCNLIRGTGSCYLVGANNTYETFTHDNNIKTGQTYNVKLANELQLDVSPYENGLLKTLTNTQYVNDGTTGNVKISTTGDTTVLTLCSGPYFAFGPDSVTVYRSLTVMNQISNNTYSPTINYTDTYYNYDPTSTNNTVNTNTNQINNATTNNNNIYNDQSQHWQEGDYVDNSDNSTVNNIDNSQINTNNTTIINNYYGNSSGGDDNGGGSGGTGGSGDGGLTDDSILGALLQAILAFFDAIGQIIMTILTGIVTVITDVLTAIGNITTNLTGITDFFTQIFSFIPEEIMSVLVLGITISVLVALIKLIRG